MLKPNFVFVVDARKRPLNPCTPCMARKLLEAGKVDSGDDLMIHWCKGLGQIDMPESTMDGGKLEAHILWLWRNAESVNVDIKAAIAGASGVEQSWVLIAIEYLVGRGAIVVDEEVNDAD